MQNHIYYSYNAAIEDKGNENEPTKIILTIYVDNTTKKPAESSGYCYTSKIYPTDEHESIQNIIGEETQNGVHLEIKIEQNMGPKINSMSRTRNSNSEKNGEATSNLLTKIITIINTKNTSIDTVFKTFWWKLKK